MAQFIVMVMIQPLIIKNYVFLHAVAVVNEEAFGMTFDFMEAEAELVEALKAQLFVELEKVQREREKTSRSPPCVCSIVCTVCCVVGGDSVVIRG
jgi:hypothetical protein